MPTFCTVTGKISDIFAGTLGELKVEFSSTKSHSYRSGDDVVSIKNLRTKTDTNGNLTVDLVPGEYVMKLITSSRRTDETTIFVPEIASASLAQLINVPAPDDLDAAAQAVLDAQAARDIATASANAASSSEENAGISETAAAASAAAAAVSEATLGDSIVTATAAKNAAEAAQAGSEAARDNAAVSANAAEVSKTNAATSASSAEVSNQSAIASANAAESYKNSAQAAATSSITAQGLAETAKTAAENSATTAQTARDEALSYRDTAEEHKNDSLLYRNAAETASTNAQEAIAYLNLSGAETTLAIAPVAFWSGVLPPMPLSEQVTKSWYNEDPSATRGARRDLPTRVAVVGEASSVTIYDLDSGTPEMWMVFTRSSTSYFASGSQTVTSLVLTNDGFIFGTSSTGIRRVSFSDDGCDVCTSGIGFRPSNPISGRNSGNSFVNDASLPQIVNNTVNAIATYTAPNASLNEAGQPIETVAVFTDGGVSVINGPAGAGTVRNITAASWTMRATQGVFTSDGKIAWICDSGSVSERMILVHDIPSEDFVVSDSDFARGNVDERYIYKVGGAWTGDLILSGGSFSDLQADGTALLVRNSAGVHRIYRNTNDPTKGMVQLQAEDFSTPVQFGRPALTALCEAEDTDLVGATPLDDDFSGYADTATLQAVWLPSSTGGDAALNAGSMEVSATVATALQGRYVPITCVIGQRYMVYCNLVNDPGNRYLQVSESTSPAGPNVASLANGAFAVGPNTLEFVATQTTMYLHVAVYTLGQTAIVDNVFVQAATPDRSVNGKGLIVNTGLDVNPVFPGARTMAYSGFNATKYLWQPYNPDLDFGTGDFLKSFWIKGTSQGSFDRIMERSDGTLISWQLTQVGTTNQLQWRLANDTITTPYAMPLDRWFLCTLVRQGGIGYIYIDDDLMATGAQSASVDLTDAQLVVGNGLTDLTRAFNGSLSLLTISAGALTPEQIRLKYLAERPRFYGGAVDPTLPETALGTDLDEVTGLLWMIGATKQWAMDGNGILAASTLADKADAAHNRIDVHEGEVSTWEYAG